MPSGELHEISLAIGRLQQSIEDSRTDHQKLAQKVDQMDSKLDVIPKLVLRLNRVEPLAFDWQKTKNKALGAIALTSLGGIGIGTGVGPAIRHIFARMFQ